MYCWPTMIKTRCLVEFRLTQSWVIYEKLYSSWCRFVKAIRPGSIDRNLGSINRKLGRMRFSADFQLSPSSFKTFRVLCFCPRYIRQTLATFNCCSYCCLCKSLVRSVRSFPLHKFRIIKKEIRSRTWWSFSCYHKNLKKHKRVCLHLLENPRKKEFVVSELARGRVSKFLLVGSNRMLVVYVLL